MGALSAFRMDAIMARGGNANSRSFRGVQKRYCRALRVEKSTGSRHFKGQNAPSTHFLVQIATADQATAYPIIAEAIATVNQAAIRTASTSALLKRLAEINEAEHEAEANENRAILHSALTPSAEQMEAAADADLVEAELQLERSAILRELAERKRRGAA